MKNIIQDTLEEHIKDQSAFFVFPTQTAADLWADRTITTGSVRAVAMERFLAWDKFKGSSIKSQHQDKTSIPSAMRLFFAENIIALNKKNIFLKDLILPEYASTSSGFTSWIANFLPSLKLWKTHFEASGAVPDKEDEDLNNLYDLYSTFLNDNNFFDPAWENPPFTKDGNHYYIFFPEILSDYSEYESILAGSPEQITMIHIPEEIKNAEPAPLHFMENSRQEIRSIALSLRKIHEEKNIPWTEMAVSVPDMESYGPYIQRELELYQIPFVCRNATALSETGAGNLFTQIIDCYNSGFNFESVKKLILNNELPWKSEQAVYQLIDFGKQNNCVCSFDYENETVDVWKESFAQYENRGEEIAKTFYNKLKAGVTSMVAAKKFADLRSAYFQFRNDFFDMEKCTEKSDRILSRCISELCILIDLEEKYNAQAESPLSFFANYIANVNYLEQTTCLGVQVLPYKLSSCAPFSYQVVVDSSQSGLSVIYKQFAFLREDKRKELLMGKEDPNATELFIKLYQMNSMDTEVLFTSASKTFTGYAQGSSYLSEIEFKNDEEFQELLSKDFYTDEKLWFCEETQTFPKKVSTIEINGLDFWKNSQSKEEADISRSLETQLKKITESWLFQNDGKIRISSTNLKKFYKCPRAWAMDLVSNLDQQNNDAELMDHRILGNLYHKIFEKYCLSLKEKNKNLMVNQETRELPEEYKNIFTQTFEIAMQEEKNSFLATEILKTTKEALYKEALYAVTEFSGIFNECAILDSEKEYVFEDLEQNIYFNGRPDCLLMDPSSTEVFLIDFKGFSSAIPKNCVYNPEKPEMPDFQMPMYIHLLENGKKSIKVDNCCFFLVSKGDVTQVFGQQLFDRVKQWKNSKPKSGPISASDFEETRSMFLEAITTFTQKVKDGDFSVDDKNQDFETCSGCGYKAICRRTFNVSKRD